jgi:hypothetical protein
MPARNRRPASCSASEQVQHQKYSTIPSKVTYWAVHTTFFRSLYFLCKGVHSVDLCHRLRERQAGIFEHVDWNDGFAFASGAFDRPWSDFENIFMLCTGGGWTTSKNLGMEFWRLRRVEGTLMA